MQYDRADDQVAAHSGGYRVPPTSRAVTIDNEVSPAGLASKVPDGSDPSTLAWPSRCPAALRRRHRHPAAAQRSWSHSFAPGDAGFLLLGRLVVTGAENDGRACLTRLFLGAEYGVGEEWAGPC